MTKAQLRLLASLTRFILSTNQSKDTLHIREALEKVLDEQNVEGGEVYDWRTFSRIGYEKLGLLVRLEVCEDEGQFYLGAMCCEHVEMVTDGAHRNGEELARDSEEAFPTREDAAMSLLTGDWTQITPCGRNF